MRLAPLDRWTLGYLAFATVLLLWRWDSGPPDAVGILIAHGLLAALALAAPALRRRGGVPGFLGEFYPLMAAVVLYTAVGLTAFPSSHVAVSLVAAGLTVREWRPLGAVLLVAASLLTLGTVYGQFHYAVDALAGAALAAAVVAVSRLR